MSETLKLKRVYLCSRTKPEYHEQNEKVAKVLEANGIEVFVPHRLDAIDPAHKEAPFDRDFLEMNLATHCVAVGKFGPDCAAEIGWFAGAHRPIICVMPTEETRDDLEKDQPMVAGFVNAIITLSEIETDLIPLIKGKH